MFLARRNLAHERTRLGLSIAGVALAVMLILLLSGYLAGVYRQASAYLEHAPGSIVVSEKEVRSFIGSSSFVSDEVLTAVRRTPGVEAVAPIVLQTVILELHSRKVSASVIGYDDALGGGPWDLAAGREPVTDDEIVLDRILADEHGIGVDDRVTVLDRQLTVSGLANGTALWIGSIAFARASAVQSWVRAPGVWSSIFVAPAAGVSDEELRASIAVAGVDAVAKTDMIESDRQALGRIYDAPLGLMIGIAFVVGVLVVGLVIYSATVERRREYGALKAIGMRNRTLYRVVATQALIAAVAGALVGVGLAFGLGAALVAWRPQFPVVIEPQAVVAVLGASLVMATLSALAPARAIGKLAPAEVFR